MSTPKYTVNLVVDQGPWKAFRVRIGKKDPAALEKLWSRTLHVPVESTLRDIGHSKSINRTGEGSLLKSSSSDELQTPFPDKLVSNWDSVPTSNDRNMGMRAGAFLSEPHRKYVRPAVKGFEDNLNSQTGLLPAVAKMGILAAIPTGLGSAGYRLFTGGRSPFKKGLRDGILALLAGGLAGGALYYGQRSEGLQKNASFGEADPSFELMQLVAGSPELTQGQKYQLRKWISFATPEVLKQIWQAIGPFAGAGVGLAIWSMFSKQKSIGGGILSALAGGVAGNFLSRPSHPTDAFGNRLLNQTDFYGRPRV